MVHFRQEKWSILGGKNGPFFLGKMVCVGKNDLDHFSQGIMAQTILGGKWFILGGGN